jgi:hypothetical protein
MVAAPYLRVAIGAALVLLCAPGCGASLSAAGPNRHLGTTAAGERGQTDARSGDDKPDLSGEETARADLARFATGPAIREPLDRAASLALLQLREQVFLPFRTASPALIDGAAIEGWRGREGLARSFRSLGVGGLHALARCVRSAGAMPPEADGVHLVGDDPLVLGLACLDMLADAYGPASLPTLLALASRHAGSDLGVALERAALERVRRIAPTSSVTRYGAGGRWRIEVDAWLDWLARQAAARPGFFALAAPTCEPSSCPADVMRGWLVHATTLVPYRGWAREPRYLTALRSYLIGGAPDWLPWLETEARRLLELPAAWAPRETGLIYDLWASTAAVADPAYFRARVAPALVGVIGTSDAAPAGPLLGNDGRGAHYPLQSELAVFALESATGLGLGAPDCAVGRAASAWLPSCVDRQTAYWRAFITSAQPLSARTPPGE